MTTRLLDKGYIATISGQEHEEDYGVSGANQLIASGCLGLLSQRNKLDTSFEKVKEVETWFEYVNIFTKELSGVLAGITVILKPIINMTSYLSEFDKGASEEEFNFLHDYVKDDFSADYFAVKELDQRIEELRRQHGISE